jgi:hypothetical protein
MEISELLQINATIITGILILLTISSIKAEPNPKKVFSRFTKEQLTALVVLPFGLSSIQLLWNSAQPDKTDFTINQSDIILPIAGFFYLIIVIFAIAKRAKIDTTSK